MRGKLEAGYYIKQTGQLENWPASWKFSGRTRKLEIIQKLLIPASPLQADFLKKISHSNIT